MSKLKVKKEFSSSPSGFWLFCSIKINKKILIEKPFALTHWFTHSKKPEITVKAYKDANEWADKEIRAHLEGQRDTYEGVEYYE